MMDVSLLKTVSGFENIIRDRLKEVVREEMIPCISGFMGKIYSPDVSVRFSDRIVKSKYRPTPKQQQALTDKLRKLIQKLKKMCPNINIANELEKIVEAENPADEISDAVYRELLDLQYEGEIGPLFRSIVFTIKALKVHTKIKLGEYHPATQTITMYRKAISQMCEGGRYNYDSVFLATLAHETFHAYHHAAWSDENGALDRCEERAQKRDFAVVAESLAKAYEIMVCRELGWSRSGNGVLAEYGQDSLMRLEDFDIETYPYCGATVFCNWNDIDEMAFRKIFEVSLLDWNLPARQIKSKYDERLADDIW